MPHLSFEIPEILSKEFKRLPYPRENVIKPQTQLYLTLFRHLKLDDEEVSLIQCILQGQYDDKGVQEISKLSFVDTFSISSFNSTTNQHPIIIDIVNKTGLQNYDTDYHDYQNYFYFDIIREAFINFFDEFNIKYSNDFGYHPHITLAFATKEIDPIPFSTSFKLSMNDLKLFL